MKKQWSVSVSFTVWTYAVVRADDAAEAMQKAEKRAKQRFGEGAESKGAAFFYTECFQAGRANEVTP